MATAKKVSVPTGKFWSCNWNRTHHRPGVALPIMKKDCFFLPKCFCGAGHAFCPPDWTADMGMTRQQALAEGLQVLALPRAERCPPAPERRPTTPK